MKPIALVVSGLLVLGVGAWSAQAAFGAKAAGGVADYKVVVNAANRAAALKRTVVSRLFLKKSTSWPDGKIAEPVDQPTSSPVRAAFSKGVLGMDTPEVAGYLNQLIFSGRGTPPLTKSSDAEVLSYVRNNASAIGYVAADANVGEGVRVVPVE